MHGPRDFNTCRGAHQRLRQMAAFSRPGTEIACQLHRRGLDRTLAEAINRIRSPSRQSAPGIGTPSDPRFRSQKPRSPISASRRLSAASPCTGTTTNIPAWTGSVARSGVTRTGCPTGPEIPSRFMSARRRSTFGLALIRDGGGEEAILERGGLSARWQDTPDQCSVEGCGWEPSFEFRVARICPSGAYRIVLTAQGRDGRPITCRHLVVVAPLAGRKPGRILQVAATGTWLAYNTWGGSNHYQGITGPNRDQYSPVVSHRAAVVPRLCRAAGRRASRAARDRPAAGGDAALSAHGMGLRNRAFQEVCLVRLGEL